MSATLAFGLAIALGACLLFQVQFLLARLILPWFGGAPAVWSTSLVVFQALLLAGYAYAHALARGRSRPVQIARHATIVGAALLLLGWQAMSWPSPVTPGDAWKPAPGGSPVWQITVLLVSAVGLPFVVLASTSPLLQRWYADLVEHGPPDEHDGSVGHGGMGPGDADRRARLRTAPYRLYAVSNLGSLVGLVSYPFVVEPRLDLFAQGRAWTMVYVAYALALAASAWHVRHVPAGVEGDRRPTVGRDDDIAVLRSERQRADAPPTARDYVLWLLLAAVPSATLQATTTRLTQDVAAVPFLWMVPLALYLVTFIVAFEYTRRYRRGLNAVAVALCAPMVLTSWPTPLMVAATLAMLLATGFSLHGELAIRAPQARWMTRYFLTVSAGGVMGSAIVALVAPVSFTSVLEYPLSIVATLLLLAYVYVSDGRRRVQARARTRPRLIAEALALVALLVVAWTSLGIRAANDKTTHATRSFFGIVRVRDLTTTDGDTFRSFIHGSTMHGVQFQSRDRRRTPTAYFTSTSGIGRAMAALTDRPAPLRIGVIGLGVGTLAAFGRHGDRFTFYEIDPQVTALSTGVAPVFTYLRDSAARVDVVGGDGRLALERSSPMQFDLLAMDAFSSDAIPVHLVTREALALYARHLRSPGSLLAINVSNRYLDLQDVIRATGAAAGFSAVRVDDRARPGLVQATSWMLLAREAGALRPFGTPIPAGRSAAWTDAFSNPLAALRWQ